MAETQTQTLQPDQNGIRQAVEIWANGGLVAFPTETVYGLGADAENSAAVARIYQAKERPALNPLIIHVADRATAQAYVEFDTLASQLAQAFWPGPLSLVLPICKGGGLSDLVSAGLSTVAIRVPAHPLAQALLREFGGAIAAPSANLSGKISPTTAAHVLSGLSGKIDAVIDGGACDVGVESTIVSTAGASLTLLRPGGLPIEAIRAATGLTELSQNNSQKPNSPGQLLSHYAPQNPVILNQTTKPDGAFWLGFGPACLGAEMNLSLFGDLTEAAANLFSYLRELDAQAIHQKIAVAPIPDTGLGRAINDRLKRAAAIPNQN